MRFECIILAAIQFSPAEAQLPLHLFMQQQNAFKNRYASCDRFSVHSPNEENSMRASRSNASGTQLKI